MYFISMLVDQAKKNLAPKMKYRGIISELKDAAIERAEKSGPAVAMDETIVEFRKKYTNLKRTQWLQLTLMTFLFGYGLTYHENINHLLISICGISIMAIIYWKLSFLSWRARKVYNSWGERNNPTPYYMSEFISEIEEDWKNLLPRNIE